MSHQAAKPIEMLNKWTRGPNDLTYAISVSQFDKFAQTYPESDACPFLKPHEDAQAIETNDEVIQNTYFFAYSPGLNLNIPIPLHPDLNETPFYAQFSYLIRVCKPFTHAKDLESLDETDLNSDYLKRGPVRLKIRKALAKGHPVIVRNGSTRFDGVSISIEDETFRRLTLSKESVVEAQDMLHAPDTMKTTFGAFWDHMYNPREILNLLDMNSNLQEGRPTYMAGIFDDDQAARTVSSSIPVTIADLERYPQWMLFGHPFAHTLSHHDSAGLCTYVTVVEGRKLWFILKWTETVITPEMWHYRWYHLSLHEALVLEYSERPPWVVGDGHKMNIDYDKLKNHGDEWEKYRVAEWVCADLEAGTTLIMPPCTLHWVEKPRMSLATGGHGLITECLPLTEIGCRMDSLSSETTNDIHSSMPLVHDAIALSLPEVPQDAINQGWTLGQLASLTRMVLQPNLYRQEVVRSDADRRYNKIPGGKLERDAKKRMEDYRDTLNIPLSNTGTYKAGQKIPVEVFEWATFHV